MIAHLADRLDEDGEPKVRRELVRLVMLVSEVGRLQRDKTLVDEAEGVLRSGVSTKLARRLAYQFGSRKRPVCLIEKAIERVNAGTVFPSRTSASQNTADGG